MQGDPTEGALLVASRKAGLDARSLDSRWPRVGELPFSSERKLMSTVHEDVERERQCVLFAKGAPDVMLPRCSHELVGGRAGPARAREARRAGARERRAGRRGTAHDRRRVPSSARAASLAARMVFRHRVDESAEQGSRLAGLIGMIDPPRTEARDAVMRARGAGIRPILITGDHPRTAAVIAAELGISDDRARDDAGRS